MGGEARCAIIGSSTISESLHASANHEVMSEFDLLDIGDATEVRAPDGSRVRVLLRTQGGSMAQFELDPGACSKPVSHRTVDELWFVLSGRGELWRARNGREEINALGPGICFSIRAGSHFQFRASQDAPLRIVAATMPPWPGPDEAHEVEGPWIDTVP